MPLTIRNSTVEYMHDAGQGTFSLDRHQITEKYLIDYVDYPVLLGDLIGGVVVTAFGQFLVPPYRHPLFNWLYCKTATPKPVGQDFDGADCGNYPAYQKCIVEATFEPLESIVDDGAPPPYNDKVILRDQVQGGVEYRTVNGTVSWDTGSSSSSSSSSGGAPSGVITDAKPAVICPIVTHTVTIFYWSNPTFALNANAGKVNDRDFRFLWETYEAETLLFEHASYTKSVTLGNVQTHDVGLVLIHRPQGWNKMPWYDQTTQEVEYYAVTPKPFKTYDFRNLFPAI